MGPNVIRYLELTPIDHALPPSGLAGKPAPAAPNEPPDDAVRIETARATGSGAAAQKRN
jgi:hypothetical protein